MILYETKENANDQSKNKKTKVLFVCDIKGTIDNASDCDYEELSKKLVLLKDKHNADEIIFSFMTGDISKSYLFHYIEGIEPFLRQYDIKLGKQFMNGNYYDDNSFVQYYKISKIDKIIDYANELKLENELISIYYTDDRPTYFNDKIKQALGNTHYCFLGIEGYEKSIKANFVGSTQYNISGVLEALGFHLEQELINEIKTRKLTMKQ